MAIDLKLDIGAVVELLRIGKVAATVSVCLNCVVGAVDIACP